MNDWKSDPEKSRALRDQFANAEPLDDYLNRRLMPQEKAALLALAEREHIAEADIRRLAGITGRGYKPPKTGQQWAEIWEIVKKHE